MIQLVLKWSHNFYFNFIRFFSNVLKLFECRRGDPYITANRPEYPGEYPAWILLLNPPDPIQPKRTQPDPNKFWQPISRKLKKIKYILRRCTRFEIVTYQNFEMIKFYSGILFKQTKFLTSFRFLDFCVSDISKMHWDRNLNKNHHQ